MRDAFHVGRGALAACAPSMQMRRPDEEADKFVLLPEVPHEDVHTDKDPHGAVIFPSLPPGTLLERNPLPYHEPPYVPKPFLGRSIELQVRGPPPAARPRPRQTPLLQRVRQK